jgi:hypothetical protein
VLHNINDIVVGKKGGTLWIKDLDIFTKWQTQAEEGYSSSKISQDYSKLWKEPLSTDLVSG